MKSTFYVCIIFLLISCESTKYEKEITSLRCIAANHLGDFDLIVLIPSNSCINCIEYNINVIKNYAKHSRIIYIIMGNNIKEINSVINKFSAINFKVEQFPAMNIPLFPYLYIIQGKSVTRIELKNEEDINKIAKYL